MNTPAHLLLGVAAFAKGNDRKLIYAAMTGAMLPDLSLYVLAGVSLFVLQIPPRVVFDELYFSDLWQSIFAVDNSFFVWGALLGIAIWRRSEWGVAFAAAGLLHLALDFPLHHDDGRPHFWPFSDWVFESPISYWDNHHHALWVRPVEAALAVISVVIIWLRRPGWMMSAIFGLLMLSELRITGFWMWVFSGA